MKALEIVRTAALVLLALAAAWVATHGIVIEVQHREESPCPALFLGYRALECRSRSAALA